MLLLYFFYSQMQDNHTITYNEFLYYVQGENGRIISDIKKPLIIYDNGKITGIFRRNDNGIDTPFATRIPPIQDNGELYNLLRKNNIVFKVESDQNSFISVFILNILPIALLVFFIFIMFRQFQGAGNKAFSFGKSRAKRFDPKDRITFNEVAGVEEAKVELQEVIEFLKDLQRFTRIGAKIPKGVLLVGPPGTGKTLLARAVAGEAGVPFFYMSGSDFLELFVGIGASRVRDLFDQGRKNAPCILFIDELDAVGRVRGAGYGGGHDEREQTLNQLLVEMDGFDPSHGVILIAATNRPDVLDPALLRPGRFDRQIVVDNPDIKGREEIFKIHTKKVALSKNVDLKKLAKATPGFSGADIANMVNEAALLAARLKKNRVTMAEFEEARDKVLMGVARKSKLIPPKDKKITAYHEAGHTIVNIFTEYSDPIHKVSVIPRGMALGITSTLPENDNYHLSKLRILDDICVLMGGRAAEEIMFGDVCTGAMNDINRATDLARKMVTQWGMSENLGPITYGQKEEPIFIGKEIATHKDYSEKTAQIIDEEIKNVIMSQYKRAKDILIENKDKMIKLADTLFERETLDSEEIYNLLGIKPKDSNGEGDTEKKTEDNE
ncbi:MAG TPA: ATP-dependent zinc metalloprotease FtsH [Spirochaetota bacterium]|nr:ATP-dependent zinc metalloprotease FtsH [Spirochaetota bacterium]HOL56496.1 ATP-dependent zinc metalloprotease FtsH [Spirochaetota bacterium]HPP03962.1 ATP-dependent zinc metalloprotease FtsH [Spirochaetota bacterium]